ncbi:right-handed parallel beta-helix repeat-containing protein [Streptomyces sp. NPDC101115]|uniref:right-handed parallel beta-helix repeat-containing protein n=1 Tax=Streptomyces sp. NPDC101115 TaxID=3366106 RepID=UPI00382B6259
MATTRYVHAGKGVRSGRFDSERKPARTVADALRAAAPGDTVVILDNAVYREPELVLDRPVTLISEHLRTRPGADPADPRFDARALPTLDGGGRHRVLRIGPDAPSGRRGFGPVTVTGVRITGGHSVHTPRDPALGAGGGIAVVDADDVLVERCVVTGNRTETAPFPAWPEADRRALRDAVLTLLGDVLPAGAVASVNRMIAAVNTMLSWVRGATPLPAIDRAALLAEAARTFDALVPPGVRAMWLAGQSFGGGVATVWASPTLRHCLIRGNTAEGRGGGLAVVGYGWPTLEGCWIDRNTSGRRGRLDGGGIGCEVSLPGRLTRDLSELDLIKFLADRALAARTAVLSPGTIVTLTPSELYHFLRWLLNPFEPNPVLAKTPRILAELVTGRVEEAVQLAFYAIAASALRLDRWSAWQEQEILDARRRAVTLRDCRVTGNSAADDGGGLYASVLSRVRLDGTEVSGNRTGSMGGGVRLTMGSAGTFERCVIRNNVSRGLEAAPPPGQRRRAKPGGGGISARNADLTLTGTRVTGNTTSDRPGGGIVHYTDTEGNMGGVPDMWTAILREVFGVTKVTVRADAASEISGNRCGYDEHGAALAKPRFAKGGGVFLLQATFPDAPRVDVTLASVRKTVHGNTALTRHYTSAVQPGTVIPTANETCVQDLLDHREWTEANDAPLLKGGTDLRFAP